MAVTGVILVLFLLGHTIGNLQVFLGREVLNTYAHFLQSAAEVLWIVRIVLIVSVILHIITSVKLKLDNLQSKPVKYQVKRYAKAKLTSRTMIWTGIMIGCFVAYHLLHFTFGVIDAKNYGRTDYYEKEAGYYMKNPFEGMMNQKFDAMKDKNSSADGIIEFDKNIYIQSPHAKVLFERADTYYMMIKGFQNPLISILYIIAVILVGFHLNHAIQSAFQTLGFNHPRYFPKIVKGSTLLSLFITLALISIPITIMFKLVGGGL